MIITEHVIDLVNCADANKWMTDNNAYGLTEKQVLSMLQEQKSDFLPYARGGFKRVKPIIIQESGSYTLGEYLVTLANGATTTCSTIEEVNKIKLEEKEKLLAAQDLSFVVNHVLVNENGDETWEVIDLFTTKETSNFRVFNPLTGKYAVCEDLQSAKDELANVRQQALDVFFIRVQQQIIGTAGDTEGDISWIDI